MENALPIASCVSEREERRRGNNTCFTVNIHPSSFAGFVFTSAESYRQTKKRRFVAMVMIYFWSFSAKRNIEKNTKSEELDACCCCCYCYCFINLPYQLSSGGFDEGFLSHPRGSSRAAWERALR